MKKFKAIAALAVSVLLIGAVGCAGDNNQGGITPPPVDDEWHGNWTRPGVSDDDPMVHICEHSCYTCGKCLVDCEEEACEEKCFDEHGRTKYVFNGLDEKVIKRGGVSINPDGLEDGCIGGINANPNAEIIYYISAAETTTVCIGATICEMNADSSVTAKTPIYHDGEQFFSRGYLKGGATNWTNFYTVWLGCMELHEGVNEIKLTGKGDAYNFRDFTFLSDVELALVSKEDSHKCTHQNEAGKCTDYTCNETNCLDKDETGWKVSEYNGGDDKILKYGTNASGNEFSLWIPGEQVIGHMANTSITKETNQTVVFSFEASEETYVRISLNTSTAMSMGVMFDEMYDMTFNGEDVSTGAKVNQTSGSGWATFVNSTLVYLKAQKGVNTFVLVHKDTNTGDNIKSIFIANEKGTINLVQAYKPGASTDVESVALTAAGNATTVNKGETLQLTATVRPGNAANKNVTFSSSDEDVATVDENGLVTAIESGEFTITVTTEDGNKTDSITLTVVIPVSSVTLTAAGGATEVAEGETLQLTATVLPENATNKNVTFSSSAEGIATVSDSGLVTAISAGEAVITATAADGKSAQITLTVTANEQKVAVESVTLSAAGNKNTIKKGETLQLTATVLPENATIKDVSFSSSAEGVATVDGNGLVTAVDGGEVTITVTTTDGGKTAEITLTVTVDVEGVTVTDGNSANSGSITVGETINLTAGVLPVNATQKGVTWKVTKNGEIVEGVLTSEGNTAAFAPTAAGEYEITATATDGTEIFGTYTAKVYVPIVAEDHFFEGEDAAMTTGSLGAIVVHRGDGDTVNARSNTSLGNINANMGATLTYRVTADEECEAGLYLNLALANSDKWPNIFSITLNGKPVEIVPKEFVQPGGNWVTYSEFWFANVRLTGGLNTIVLTVTGYCGNYDYMTLKSTANITAAQVVTDIRVSVSKELLKPAETTRLGITVIGPAENVSVTSSNPGVATVDAEGNVTAVAEGKTTITVKSTDGGNVTKAVNIFVKAGEGTAYEAEAAQLTNCNVEIANGNYVGGINNAGAKVTFTVNSTAGGKVFLRIYTSIVHADKMTIDKYYSVTVNGEDADLSEGTLAYNGGSMNYNTDTGYFTVEVELTAGENTIELISAGTFVATTLDKIVIYE